MSDRPAVVPAKKARAKRAKIKTKNHRTFTHGRGNKVARHKETTRSVVILARRERAFALLKTGMTFKEIGTRLGVSIYTAWTDCRAVFDEGYQRLALDADAWRRLHIERAEGIVKAHYSKKANAGSAQTVLRALDYQAKLIPGLHQPPEGTYTADQVAGLMRGIAGLFMELVDDGELRKRFALGVRRRLGSAAVIEVTAEKEEGDAVDVLPADGGPRG